MLKDRYGLIITTNSLAAAEKYFQAMDSALAGNAFSEKWFEEAATLDPQFALAQLAHGENLILLGKINEGKIALNNAKHLAINSTPREQSHIEIVTTLLAGFQAEGLEGIINHVKIYPTDALLVSKAVGGFGLFAFSGQADHNLQRLLFMNSLANAYGEDWWFMSMHAFALVEVFRLQEAQILIEKSLKLNERNGHAAHTYTHVCYENGKPNDCIKYASNFLKNYEREAHLYGHIHWHWALSELAVHNFDKVLEIYNQHLRPAVAIGGPLGLIADAAALDWRCQLEGYNLLDNNAKEELGNYVSANDNLEDILFGEAHLALVYARQSFNEKQTKLHNSINTRYLKNSNPKYVLMQGLIEGVTAYSENDYKLAIRKLNSVRPELSRLGGSNAQRELFEDTLIKAYLKVGNAVDASVLIDARIHRRK